MKKIQIYKYKSNYGSVVTHIDLEIGNPTILFRLVADQGKILTDGKNRVDIAEVYEKEISLWQEVNKTEEELLKEKEFYNQITNDSDSKYKQLLDIVTGNEEGEDE